MTNAENNNAVVAFNKAQANMGKAIKNSKNPFLNNNYADLESVQNAVFAAFQAEGFAILQCGGADQYGHYVETILAHSSGEQFTSKVYLELKKGDMQSVGSAITYARRYGLTMLTGVPVTDDDGNDAVGKEEMQNKIKAQARGLKSFLMKSPSADKLIEEGERARAIMDNLKQFDKEGHKELVDLWNEAEKLEGIK